MEKFVVSRELAERLREAGYPQKTEYMWCKYSLGGWMVLMSDIERDISLSVLSGERLETMAAPMSDELLEQLRQFDWEIVNLNSETLSLTSDSLDEPEAAIFGKNFVEVLAKFWLELREQGHIKPEAA